MRKLLLLVVLCLLVTAIFKIKETGRRGLGWNEQKKKFATHWFERGVNFHRKRLKISDFLCNSDGKV